MTQMSLTGTQTDLVTEDGNCHTSVGQRDGAPAETDSDSGDSLFITQKPVPEAVRSGRRRRSSFRSDPPSPTDADASDCSASPQESKPERKKAKRFKLPMYSFSFLRQRRIGHVRLGELKIKQNTSLHNAVTGGFFKCARELWQSCQGEEDLESSLPTVDMPGESIPPISEEEEKPDEDIRVVEKKRFVVSFKAKCSQPWCTSNQGDSQEKQQRERRSMKAGHETSQGGQRKMLHKIPPVAPKSREILSTDTDSDEDGDASSRALVERETRGKLVTSDTSVTETPETKKQKENEDDISASVCERSPKSPEAPTAVTEPQEDAFLTDELSQSEERGCEPESQNLPQTDANNATVCSDSRVKKKTKDGGDHEVVEEEKGQSQEEPDGQHDAGFTEIEETPIVPQTIAELEIHGKNSMASLSPDDNTITLEERDVPESKKTKKKRKNKLAAEDVREEESGQVESDVRLQEEDSVFSGSWNMKKKKKKKRNEDDVLLKSNLPSEPLNDVPKKPKKKRNRKTDVTSEPTEELEEIKDCLENTDASQETSESSYVKRKKHKKKQKASSNEDAPVGGHDCVDGSFSNDIIAGVSVKKKKKKKNTEEDENVDNTQNATRGGEDRDAELPKILSEDTVAQSNDSVSVRRKKKKGTCSFLVADAEEHTAQTHEETPSVAAHSWPADRPAGESAETTGSLEKADDGVRKKKKKRKKESAEQEKAEKDHQPDSEEPDRTRLTAAAETGLRRKKKRRRGDSESVTSMERGERAPDCQTEVEKKKKKKDAQEIPPAATEHNGSEESALNVWVSLSHKRKGSTVAAKGINDTCTDSRAADDQATKETLAEHASLSSKTPENQASNDVRGKKKKKKVKAADRVLLEGNLFREGAEIDAHEPKKKDRTQPAAESSFSSLLSDMSVSQCETSSSHSSRKNKHKKAKRRLCNSTEDFFTD